MISRLIIYTHKVASDDEDEERNTPACAGTTPRKWCGHARREHPRVREDDDTADVFGVPINGTPPRARGRSAGGPLPEPEVGNTPACAGTTSNCANATPVRPEHPRVRADDPGTRPTGHEAGGTPPRARGRPEPEPVGRSIDRNTPACGDDFATTGHNTTELGTPPHARGRHVQRGLDRHQRRNTPACAGTTGCGTRSRGGSCQHPRVRGDDRPTQPATSPPGGTRRGRCADTGSACRNTPACAGTTRTRRPPGSCRSEHPRVRGDDEPGVNRRVYCPGTPPRARGRLQVGQRPGRGVRNTPACAGTTTRVPRATPESPEHPRVRGDDLYEGQQYRSLRGTPPRARGRRVRGRRAEPQERNTPACAGTTSPAQSSRPTSSEHPRVRGDDC